MEEDGTGQQHTDTRHPLYRYMEALIQNHRTGFAVLEMNAGGGKSYQMDHLIADEVGAEVLSGQDRRRFMIMCPAKKILKQSLDDLKALGLREGIGKDILWIRSREDSGARFLEAIGREFTLPSDFEKGQQRTFHDALQKYQDAVREVLHNNETQEELKSKNNDRLQLELSAATAELNHVIRQIAMKRYASQRASIRKKNPKITDKELYDRIVDLIRKDPDFAFLKWYCPVLYADDVPILLMTSSKGDYPISSPFYTTSLPESSIVKNRVIFMDEEDECKAMTEEKILDETFADNVNLLSMMQRLGACFENHESETAFENFMMHDDGRAGEEGEYRICRSLKEEYQKLQDEYQRMKKDWNLMEYFVPDRELREQEDQSDSFLLRSAYLSDTRSRHTHPLYLYAHGNHNVVSHADMEGENQAYAKLRDSMTDSWRQLQSSRRKKNASGKTSDTMDTLSEEMAWLVRQVLKFIRGLAFYYCELNPDQNIRDVEARIVYQMLQGQEAPGSHDGLQNFLISNLYESLYDHNTHQAKKGGRTFFDLGLHRVRLERKEGPNQPYLMQCFMCSDTPEKDLCSLAEHTLVIAISATAGIESDICNYDFGYMKSHLKTNFLSMPEKVRKALWKYEEDHCDVHGIDSPGSDVQNEVSLIDLHVPFSVEELLLPDASYWTRTGKAKDEGTLRKFLNTVRCDLCGLADPGIFQRKYTWQDLGKMIRRSDADLQPYVVRRILCCLAVLKKYIQMMETGSYQGVDSVLCILNGLPKRKDGAGNLILEAMMQAMCMAYQVRPADYPLHILHGTEDTMEKLLHDIDRDFLKGKHPFVVTAYNACGYASNLQHRTLVKPQDVVQIRSDRHRNLEDGSYRKDYDLIFLDEPSNVIPNMLSQDLGEMEQRKQELHLEYIGEELYESGDLPSSSEESSARLYRAIRGSEAYRYAAAKTLIQGAARIQRTGIKSHHTEYIFPYWNRDKQPGLFSLAGKIDLNEHLVGVETRNMILNLRNLLFRGADVKKEEFRAVEITRSCRRFYRTHETLLDQIFREPSEDLRSAWSRTRLQSLHTSLTSQEYKALDETDRRSYFLIPEDRRETQTGYWFRCLKQDENKWCRGDIRNRYGFDRVEVLFQEENPNTVLSQEEKDNGQYWTRMDAAYCHMDSLFSLVLLNYGVDMGSLLRKMGLTENLIEKDSCCVLHPASVETYWKGVIGEVCGQHLLEKICHLHPTGVEVEHLEVMDAKIVCSQGTIYIDYKNWNRIRSWRQGNVTNEQMKDQIRNKAEKLQSGIMLYLLPAAYTAPEVFGMGKPDSLQTEGCAVYTCEGLVYLDQDGKWNVNTELASDIQNLVRQKGGEYEEN